MHYGGHFDASISRYRCCCNVCNAKLGAIIVATVQTLGLILILLCLLVETFTYMTSVNINDEYGKKEEPPDKEVFIVHVVFFAALATIFASVLVLFWYGLFKEKPLFLIPELVVLVLQMVAGVIFFIMFVVFLLVFGADLVISASKSDTRPGVVAKRAGEAIVLGVVALLLAFGVYLCLGIWFFTIVLACYRLFKEKSEASLPAGSVLCQHRQLLSRSNELLDRTTKT